MVDKDLSYYNDVYSKSVEYRKSPENSMYMDLWKAILNLTSNKESIIEVGCGSGQLANLLIKNGRNYLKGYDYSEVAIKIARDINKNYRNRFFIKDIYDMTPSDVDCNTVICTEVLEHLDDDFALLATLKKETRFIFSVPDFWYKTHKRVFKTFDEIVNRYEMLTIEDYSVFNTKGGNKIFLVESIV